MIMELLETQDPHKRKLIEKSERHRKALEKDVKAVSEKTEKVLKNSLIIVGSLTMAYFITSQFNRKRKKKKLGLVEPLLSDGSSFTMTEQDAGHPSSLMVRVGGHLINQAVLLLLQVAKDKLVEYLAERRNHNEDS
jgi:reverse gyrase